MPHLHQPGSQLPIPFGGRSPRARSASLAGARICKAGSQAARMLVEYFHAGPLTDLLMAERLGLPESRISARRSGLIERRLVIYVDDVIGPHSAPNGRYELSGYGREVASVLAKG